MQWHWLMYWGLGPVAGEVCKRLHAAGVQGRMLTLKLKRRKAGAPEPPKFMGHGSCDNLSRSITLPHFTAAEKEVATAARSLLRVLRVPAAEIRGIGIAVGASACTAASALQLCDWLRLWCHMELLPTTTIA